jgi:hypothetical protein
MKNTFPTRLILVHNGAQHSDIIRSKLSTTLCYGHNPSKLLSSALTSLSPGAAEGIPTARRRGSPHAISSLPPLPPVMPRWRRAHHYRRWWREGRIDDFLVVFKRVRRGTPGRRPWSSVVGHRPRRGVGRASCGALVCGGAGGRSERDGARGLGLGGSRPGLTFCGSMAV